MPLLTIGIPCYGGDELLGRLLRSISRCVWADRCDVLVLDDGSPTPILEQIPDCDWPFDLTVQRNKQNLGCVATYNEIMRAAQTDLVVLMDNDVVLPTEWIRSALELRKALRPDVGVLSWKSIHISDSPEAPVFNQGGGDALLEPATELAGYCYMLHKPDWDRVGGFDEGLRQYQGDSDLCVRLWMDLGLKSYRVNYPVVGHQEHATLGRYAKETKACARTDMACFKEKWGCTSGQMQKALLADAGLD